MPVDIDPTTGWIDEVEVSADGLEISGWAASFQHAVLGDFIVQIGARKYSDFKLEKELPSPDVAALHPGLLSADKCRFRLSVPMSGDEIDEIRNSLIILCPIFAGSRGNAIVSFVQPNTLVPPEEDVEFVGGNYNEGACAFFPYLVDYGNLSPTDNVLDAGCGIGRMAVPLTRYLSKDAFYEGFDIFKNGIKWCRKNITKQYPNFNFHHADIFNKHYNLRGNKKASEFVFPYESDSFDFAFLTSVFTHMYPDDVSQYLREIGRTLKTGGRCIFTCFMLNSESARLIKNGKSTQNLIHEFDGFYSIDRKYPERAIGFDQDFILNLASTEKLSIDSVHYGSWCGRDRYVSYQDFVVVHSGQ